MTGRSTGVLAPQWEVAMGSMAKTPRWTPLPCVEMLLSCPAPEDFTAQHPRRSVRAGPHDAYCTFRCPHKWVPKGSGVAQPGSRVSTGNWPLTPFCSGGGGGQQNPRVSSLAEEVLSRTEIPPEKPVKQ